MSFGFNTLPYSRKFVTSDGSIFYFCEYWIDGRKRDAAPWVDNTNPDFMDLTCDGSASGPIDSNGQPYEGTLWYCQQARLVLAQPPHFLTLKGEV